MLTAEPIAWRHSLGDARDEASQSGKLVLIELFSPKCLGCQNMEHRTFSDGRVQRLIDDAFVPVHYDVLNEPEHLKQFMAFWTPTLIFQCGDANEHRRSIGFLPPEKFIPELALAHVQYAMNRQDYDQAHRWAQEAVELSENDLHRHTESLYWQAVAAYKASEDQDKLIAGWKDLITRFPDSDWAARCDFARDL